jgi:hypothetical protein
MSASPSLLQDYMNNFSGIIIITLIQNNQLSSTVATIARKAALHQEESH